MSSSSSFRRSTLSRSSSTASATGNGSSENLPPRMLARVGREIRDLHKNPPEGVRLVVDSETGCPENLGEIIAEIQGPVDTPYETRYFQLKLHLPPDFPDSPPRGFFLTKIYHPNVDTSNGAICVNTLKRDWTKETTFSHVLSVVRCLLIIPFPESSLNDEAGRLFMDDYEEYAQRARLMAEVHAQSRPSTTWNNNSNNNEKLVESGASENNDGNKMSVRVMADINGNGKGRTSSSQRKESKKSAADKKTKKKGLKRL